jgi:hypothetical protein
MEEDTNDVFFLRDCGISFLCGSYEITFLWKKERKKTQMMYCDECLKMPIWTPSFIFVRLLVLLISNILVYFSVLLCCRSLL